jgi:hypothetical protein
MRKPALYKNFSGVRKMRTAQNFYKCALAGAILANEAQNLTSVQFHRYVFQSMHAWKRFSDVAHFQ